MLHGYNEPHGFDGALRRYNDVAPDTAGAGGLRFPSDTGRDVVRPPTLRALERLLPVKQPLCKAVAAKSACNSAVEGKREAAATPVAIGVSDHPGTGLSLVGE